MSPTWQAEDPQPLPSQLKTCPTPALTAALHGRYSIGSLLVWFGLVSFGFIGLVWFGFVGLVWFGWSSPPIHSRSYSVSHSSYYL